MAIFCQLADCSMHLLSDATQTQDVRLCHISRQVNTRGGTNTVGEGIEKEGLRDLLNQSQEEQDMMRELFNTQIIYADPMDLTKMINVAPGTQVLSGVGESLKLFFVE